jgi:hypothetical protein
LSWLGTSDREGREPPPDEAGRDECAAIPPLAPTDDEDCDDWLAGPLEAESRVAWVLMPCVMPVTGRVMTAADCRDAGS